MNFFLLNFVTQKNRNFFIFLLLISIIALLFLSDSPLIVWVCVSYTFVLTIHMLLKPSTIYIFCQSRSYVNSKSTELMFLFTSYYVNAWIFLIISLVLLVRVIDFITPFTPDFLDTWVIVVSIWLSSVSFIAFFGYLNKILSRCEYDLPEEL